MGSKAKPPDEREALRKQRIQERHDADVARAEKCNTLADSLVTVLSESDGTVSIFNVEHAFYRTPGHAPVLIKSVSVPLGHNPHDERLLALASAAESLSAKWTLKTDGVKRDIRMFFSPIDDTADEDDFYFDDEF